MFRANVPPLGCRGLWVASTSRLCGENPLKSSRFSYHHLPSHSLKNSPETSQFSPLYKIYKFFFFGPFIWFASNAHPCLSSLLVLELRGRTCSPKPTDSGSLKRLPKKPRSRPTKQSGENGQLLPLATPDGCDLSSCCPIIPSGPCVPSQGRLS